MSEKRRFAFILNPNAGRGRARRIEERLVEFLRRKGVAFTLERTREPLHATEMAAQASKDFDVVVAVGGDGTVNEVANGVAGTEAAMAVLPLGSGNDFSRLLGGPSSLEGSVNSILKGERRVFDLGHLTVHDRSGASRTRHFINSLGMGLDAVVADQTRRIQWLRGLPLYLTAVAKALVHFERLDAQICLDGHPTNSKAYLICVGNGNFEGGGFQLTPGADPHDQKFEVCVIKDMPILRAIGIIPSVIRGTHGKHPKVILQAAQEVVVKASKPFTVHADGEVIGTEITSLRAVVKAGHVGVLVPAEA